MFIPIALAVLSVGLIFNSIFDDDPDPEDTSKSKNKEKSEKTKKKVKNAAGKKPDAAE